MVLRMEEKNEFTSDYIKNRCIDPLFLAKYMYAVFKAMYKELGVDTWNVYWLIGKYLYQIVKDELNITKSSSIKEIIRNVGTYLKNAGCIEDFKVIISNISIFQYRIKCLHEFMEYLPKGMEDMSPGFIFTSLMNAAIIDRGHKIKRIDEPKYEDGYFVDTWEVQEYLNR